MSKNQQDFLTSPSLLLRIRDPNDAQSWNAFQAVYRPMIFAYCLKRGLQEADALDVVQEVLGSVSRAILKFEYQPEKGRFRSWLGTVISNKIKTFKTKRHHEQSLDSDLLFETTENSSIADPDSEWVAIFSEHIFQTACERVQARVEPVTWTCFQATWLHHRPATQIARELNLPIHTVYVNKSRVLKHLEAEVLELADDSLINYVK